MRNLGTVTNPVDIPRKQDIAAAGLNDLPANPSLYLNGNGAWTTPSLTGNNSWWETDVNGDLMPMLLPTGDPIEGANVILSENLTDHAIPRGNGGGSASKILQNSLALIDDNGSINIPSGQTYNINGSPHTHTEAQVTNLSTDLAAKAPLASPTFTGTPAAPTASADTSTTQLATTAFVIGQASSTTPVVNGTAAVGTSKKYARADHVHPTDTSRAAATHTHAATDVTSGQLALAYGGTGAATAVAARTNLKALGNGVYYSLATSGSITIDWNNGCTQGPSAAMTAAITLATPSNPVNPEVYRLKFSCGATAYQVTWWSSGVVPKWAGGTAPTFAANKTYIITLLYDGTYYYASSVEF